MTPVVDTGLAAIITKSILDHLKNWGVLPQGVPTLIASFIVNFCVLFVLSVLNSLAGGQSVTIGQPLVVQTAAATILAAVYNDVKNSLPDQQA